MKILPGITEIPILEVSCSSTGCKSSAELMLSCTLSAYISPTYQFLSLQSCESSVLGVQHHLSRRQNCKWTHGPRFHLFFLLWKKKKNLTFESISYLESVFFSKKMKLFVSIPNGRRKASQVVLLLSLGTVYFPGLVDKQWDDSISRKPPAHSSIFLVT